MPKENDPTKTKIESIYHYYQYIAYLLAKDDAVYPCPYHGSFVNKDKVISSWQNTVKLIKEGKAPKKFCLYVHFPFCKSRCLYCMLGTFAIKEKGSFIQRYLEYLYEEIKELSKPVKDVEVTTLYFGGGTPSLLEPSEIKDLMQKLKSYFNITKDTRIIFEPSPFSLTKKKLDVLKEEGVYELAMGVQTFDQKVLDKNQRPQNVEETKEIIKYAQEIGIPSITADMIIGMPYQDPESALDSIKEAARLDLDGIWVNTFLPLRQTRFSQEHYTIPKEKRQRQIKVLEEVDTFLTKQGYISSNLGYRKSLRDIDKEKGYLTQENWSLMGLGYGSYSHAFGSLKYEKTYPPELFIEDVGCQDFLYNHSGMSFKYMFENFLQHKYRQYADANIERKNLYTAFELDLKKEMCVYAVSNLPRINLNEFKRIFGEDFLKIFKTRVKILAKLGLGKVKQDYFMVTEKPSTFRKIAKAFFVDKDYIKKLLQDESEVYDPSVDYLKLLEGIVRP